MVLSMAPLGIDLTSDTYLLGYRDGCLLVKKFSNHLQNFEPANIE